MAALSNGSLTGEVAMLVQPSIPALDASASPEIVLVGYGSQQSGCAIESKLEDLMRISSFATTTKTWPESPGDWDELLLPKDSYSNIRLVVIFNEPPKLKYLCHLYRRVMHWCDRQKNRRAYVVKNFRGRSINLLHAGKRALRMLHFVDLESQSVENFLNALTEEPKPSSFSSRGESFAWQLVTGFLSSILPRLARVIGEQIDDQLKCSSFKIDPSRILVIPKYFLLLNKSILRGRAEFEAYPSQLFPECNKITDGKSDLCLVFGSSGYAKQMPAYLVRLDKPLPDGYSHAYIICGYAAPTFVIRQLDLGMEERESIFDEFTDELKMIVKHRSFGQLLCDFDGTKEAPTGMEWSSLSLIEHTDTDSNQQLQSRILEEIFNYQLLRDWDNCGTVLKDHKKDPETDGFVLVEEESQQVSVIFSESFTSDEKHSVENLLESLDIRVGTGRDRASLNELERVLFILHQDDLRSISDKIRSAIVSAVRNLHHCRHHNISVILVADVNKHGEVFELLPSDLRDLPDFCTAVVSSLSDLSRLQFAFPCGLPHRASFSELVCALGLDEKAVRVEESLLLMSAAYAMVANIWHGFAQHLLDYMKSRSSDPEVQRSLPYCFVIPSSGHYPDYSNMYTGLESIGVSWSVVEFNRNGRRYTFRKHQWECHELMFEIPTSLLSIRKQTECCIGGVRARSLAYQLREFSDELEKFCLSSNGCFRVVYWDDTSVESPTSTVANLTQLARNLMLCLIDAKNNGS